MKSSIGEMSAQHLRDALVEEPLERLALDGDQIREGEDLAELAERETLTGRETGHTSLLTGKRRARTWAQEWGSGRHGSERSSQRADQGQEFQQAAEQEDTASRKDSRDTGRRKEASAARHPWAPREDTTTPSRAVKHAARGAGCRSERGLRPAT